ncbi:hypothetical protein [Arthrobacter sp. OAP107]|uniref:hypothetical protein n=1 Tax=Arthrobacter sp. OAP107 TaxID=3156445 RepID=UPI00339A30EC
MSGSEHDPIDFREVDAQGNPTGYGPATGQTGLGQRQAGTGYFGQRRLAANPFIVALWVLEAILLVSPFGVFTIAQESLNSVTEPQVMPVSYMWITFAPQILFAGLAGLLGLLFWHAAQWQRNRAKQPPPS